MRNFLIAFLFFLLWCSVAFLYFTTDLSISAIEFISKPFSSQVNPDNFAEKKDTTIYKSPVNESLESLSSLVEPNQAKLSIVDPSNELIIELDSLSIKKNLDSVFFQKLSLTYFEPLVKYLFDNKETGIIISSDYSANEKFMTPNIGIQRSQYIKNELAKLGIDKQRINLKSNIKEIKYSNDGFSAGGISIETFKLSEKDLMEIEKNKVRNFIVYPRFTFSKIIVNKELKEFAKELKTILTENESYSVKIIGHTDNIGSKADNFQMGLKYAQQAGWYLINREGVDPKRLTVLSKGEENPIDDNNTVAGRKNNLRIEFVIE
ncbi:OmpA family protein [uncultured Planktosalinus sp.]|uniref:OmpA family protein n=1 Tax=uncultured Planktosalinus sp. TaxID=1810935 RepID=UPI0030DAB9A9